MKRNLYSKSLSRCDKQYRSATVHKCMAISLLDEFTAYVDHMSKKLTLRTEICYFTTTIYEAKVIE